MVSQLVYSALILALLIERGVELWLSRRNARWARSQGAIEYGAEHLGWMKALHTTFFIGCVAEVWLLSRPFIPALAVACGAVALVAQALRYWAILTLGRRWNIAVLVLPGVPAVASGPFRYLRHPNYVAVVLEGLAVPLAHGAFITAGVFTVLNGLLLAIRIDCEERALEQHCQYGTRASRTRFWPTRSPDQP